ncbi:hypothetical protein NDU88_010022 [Pleurodeles waltl]|uniref:Secreted protein n=1 Tax=Pleurodeles waltl TaxID=8319 RepID=A0AAV7RZY5_PLEWA|nr:hypothetical protein NDU88_010022 [Pleurodeles waltl]
MLGTLCRAVACCLLLCASCSLSVREKAVGARRRRRAGRRFSGGWLDTSLIKSAVLLKPRELTDLLTVKYNTHFGDEESAGRRNVTHADRCARRHAVSCRRVLPAVVCFLFPECSREGGWSAARTQGWKTLQWRLVGHKFNEINSFIETKTTHGSSYREVQHLN